MAYITADDLIAEFGEDEIRQLTDRGRNHTVDTDLVDRKIASAQSEVDAYLRGRIQLPFADDTVPPVIRELMLAITRYRLYLDPTEAVAHQYQQATQRLRDIAAGKVVLGAGVDHKPGGRARIRAEDSPVADLAGYDTPYGCGRT